MQFLPLSEEDIHAYVDGRLSPQRRYQVEELLASDPEARAKVAAYELQKRLLRRLFPPVNANDPRTSRKSDEQD